MERERPNPLEELTNQYWRLIKLQEEGKNVQTLLEETWEKIRDLIENVERNAGTGRQSSR